MSSELESLKKTQQEDSKRIKLLGEQLRALSPRQHKASSPEPSISPTTLKQVEATIVEGVHMELAPLLQKIQHTLLDELEACDKHIYKQIWELFEPALKLTENFHRL